MSFCQRKKGLSGIMRAKNEAQFIEASINSCIDALDELVIVYNDCTDETPEIIKKKQKQYPEKIKAYAYNYNVFACNLNEEELEYVKKLPDNSPQLFCNQCNFALSKVNYKYAMIIDPDQIYFTDNLKEWRDICSGNSEIKWSLNLVLGWLFMIYISLYRRFSLMCRKPCLKMLPIWLINRAKKHYENYAKWKLNRNKATIAVSGINVFFDKNWYVPFDKYNIHPPYNGASDHLIFCMDNDVYFSRCYHKNAVMELFHQPNRIMFADKPLWFHQHANRQSCWSKVKTIKDRHPDMFVSINDFANMTYEEVDAKGKDAFTLFQRTSFALVHKMGVKTIKKQMFRLIALTDNICV